MVGGGRAYRALVRQQRRINRKTGSMEAHAHVETPGLKADANSGRQAKHRIRGNPGSQLVRNIVGAPAGRRTGCAVTSGGIAPGVSRTG
jgi:hypothetical protein